MSNIFERYGITTETLSKAISNTEGTIVGLENFNEPGLAKHNTENINTTSNPKSYSFFSQDVITHMLAHETMNNPNAPGCPESKFLMCTNDNTNFRIYMCASQMWTQRYLNTLMHFLDTRTNQHTVTIILGTKMSDYGLHIYPSVLSAIQSCQANVITIAAGYCSIPETFIWAYGKTRKVYRYGALSIGKSDYSKFFPEQQPYFEHCLDRLVEIQLITQEERDDIAVKGRERLILYTDYIKRFPE